MGGVGTWRSSCTDLHRLIGVSERVWGLVAGLSPDGQQIFDGLMADVTVAVCACVRPEPLPDLDPRSEVILREFVGSSGRRFIWVSATTLVIRVRRQPVKPALVVDDLMLCA